ncbi:Peptidyl-prolyl cis-trans isomerase-like 4 [Nymphon striatum]|nr:Peptidyl-prolyl cis-trans isomerase-like 4 [Nymphon striatum]
MSVILETTIGDIVVDLHTKERPRACFNFLKLCKIKYYNFSLFHKIENVEIINIFICIKSNFIAQTGDPIGTGRDGESVFSKLYGEQAKFFEAETNPRMKHIKMGTVSMVCDENGKHGSQFFITLGENLDYLDGKHTVFGEVEEGFDVLEKLNGVICDENKRPYKDVRISHTVIVDDPYDDPKGLEVPDQSPKPTKEQLANSRIGADENVDDAQSKSIEEIEEDIKDKEAKARATILEMVGDLPEAEAKPEDNVLFVCKLNPVTTSEDLEIIFTRFGTIKSCEVIRDKVSGESLQYSFIEFSTAKECENAYLKMDNVLIDDRRIHVDFSQSVAHLQWKKKGQKGQKMDNDSDKKRPQLKIKSNERKDDYDLVSEEKNEAPSQKEDNRVQHKKKMKIKQKNDSGSSNSSDSDSEDAVQKKKKGQDNEEESSKHKAKDPVPVKRGRYTDEEEMYQAAKKAERKKSKKYKKHRHSSSSSDSNSSRNSSPSSHHSKRNKKKELTQKKAGRRSQSTEKNKAKKSKSRRDSTRSSRSASSDHHDLNVKSRQEVVKKSARNSSPEPRNTRKRPASPAKSDKSSRNSSPEVARKKRYSRSSSSEVRNSHRRTSNSPYRRKRSSSSSDNRKRQSKSSRGRERSSRSSSPDRKKPKSRSRSDQRSRSNERKRRRRSSSNSSRSSDDNKRYGRPYVNRNHNRYDSYSSRSRNYGHSDYRRRNNYFGGRRTWKYRGYTNSFRGHNRDRSPDQSLETAPSREANIPQVDIPQDKHPPRPTLFQDQAIAKIQSNDLDAGMMLAPWDVAILKDSKMKQTLNSKIKNAEQSTDCNIPRCQHHPSVKVMA